MKHKAFAFFQKINDMLVTPSYPTGHVWLFAEGIKSTPQFQI
jgi:hypothetical protein